MILDTVIGHHISSILSKHGLLIDEPSRRRLLIAGGKATLQAYRQVMRESDGDYRPDPDANRFPSLNLPNSGASPLPSTSVSKVFERYATESKLKPRTVKRWRPIMAAIDAKVPAFSEITQAWVIVWKDELIAAKLSHRTVRDVYLAALKSVCAWGAVNGYILSNPVLNVKLKVPKARKKREKGFSNSEAVRILIASHAEPPRRLSPHRQAARRWIPLLCAYTGARVGEIAQLRREDLKEESGIALMHITPEAGTVKTDQARWIALHPAILRSGFLDWVAKRPDGHLFYNLRAHRGLTPPSERVGQHLSDWVREDVGIDDMRIAPNHAWRHRFATLARRYKLLSDARRYMMGHAPASTDEEYGDHTPQELFDEILKIPEVEIGSLGTRNSGSD
ncbi:hypothetical protein ABLE91_03000 [Aquabacter sp. CN5-332]